MTKQKLTAKQKADRIKAAEEREERLLRTHRKLQLIRCH